MAVKRVRRVAALLALSGLLASARPTHADELRPVAPLPADPDAGLGAKQVGFGLVALLGTSALAGGLLWASDRWDSNALLYGSFGVMLLSPTAVGMAVCEVGSTSKAYDGRCFPTVGGAYIGALGVLPGVLLGGVIGCSGSSSSSSSDDSSYSSGLESCLTMAIVGGAIGYTVGTLLGAYNGWRIFKRAKPGTLSASLL
jgi:hypothetical protein